MKHLIIIISILAAIAAKGQTFTAELVVGEGLTDTEICKNKAAQFTAKAFVDGTETTEATFSMDFDDGTIVNNATEGTFNHAFASDGIFMPMVKAQYNGLTAYAKVIVKVGKSPDFKGFKTDIDEKQQGICLGESVTLDMPISSTKSEYNNNYTHTELIPQSIYAKKWEAIIRVKQFDAQTVADGSEIESVSVRLNHQKAGEVKITLSCPNGKSVILKDYSTSEYKLGLTGKKDFGTLYNYTFNQTSATTLNATISDTLLREGAYKADEDFTLFAGCPLNGDWNISVESQSTDYEGYAEEFAIKFNSTLLENNKLSLSQTYDTRRAVWTGTGVSATSEGKCSVTPQDYDVTRYNYLISDNFGCFHDTTIYITVEKPSFSGGGDSTTFIGDEVEFKDLTTWAAQSHWIFGDKTPDADANPAPHAYYEKSVYTVIMQSTSSSGCTDRDTQRIVIVPRPLEIKEVNIFTPNGDGQNDIFTFFDPKESFLKSGGLTKMPANVRSIKGKIYNVYGQTVYKWNEVEASVFGWDGTIDNKGSRDCPPGTYFYDIIVYGKDGNSIKRSGSIYLYRQK